MALATATSTDAEIQRDVFSGLIWDVDRLAISA
jgi:hypothetical protein